MLTIGSLFSGIGGLELGLEWAGLGPVVWQCEQDPFCRSVLERHWPGVERFEDVTKLDGRDLQGVDLLCGGPPCQPFSTASRGRRVAKDLFPDFIRIATDLSPRFVVAENVAPQPIWDATDSLRREGYEATALEIPASLVGAAHERTRWFLVAHSNGKSESRRPVDAQMAGLSGVPGPDWWHYGPAVGMDDGILHRVDRLRALGNAVVPQCAEVVGCVIRELMRASV